MKRLSFITAAFLIAAAFVSFSYVSANDKITVGATLDNFTLPDTNGAQKSLNDLKGKNGAILVFISTQCPVVRGYNERIIKLAADYQSKGVNVIGINSNATESPETIKSHAAENYKFPVLIDKGNVLADKLDANTTPETFYFDAKNVLVYHGAIDNDRSGENVTNNYLRDALDQNLSGKPVAKTSANAFGCSIKRMAKN